MNTRKTSGLGGKLRHLIDLLDSDVQAVYRSRQLDYRPRFTPIMKALKVKRPISVKGLAKSAMQSHSATSQTVAAMKRAGLVRSCQGEDGRMQMVDLTTKALDMFEELERCWTATDAAAAELDSQLDQSLAAAVTEAISALQDTSFRTRIETQRERQDQARAEGIA